TGGVKTATDPLQEMIVLLMGGIRDCSQEVLVPTGATDILWRAGVLASQATKPQSLLGGSGVRDFDGNDMMPVAAEVIDIVETARLRGHRPAEHDTLFIQLLEFIGEVRVVGAVALTPEDKLMQVAVSPAHAYLDDVVESRECEVLRNDHSTPH